MSVGFVMLVHEALDRAAAVARHLAAEGCPVVVHVDRRVPARAYRTFAEGLSGHRRIRLASRHRCDWGTWSLVQASRSAAAELLAFAPQVGHVYLISGTCLPIKPIGDLRDFLARHPRTDFIESVTVAEVPWTKDGLSDERFLFSFPVSWRRHRRIFDALVDLQRRVGRRRKPPAGISPHMGSQWWCLSRETLTRILTDPDRPRIDRFFRRVWIPDESYYQTLVRRYGANVESRSLTLSRFGFQGRPHVFYDDHLRLLRQSSAFFARKIWPGARGLYDAFLVPDQLARMRVTRAAPGEIDRTFAEAFRRRTRGRPGLVMASRAPCEGFENGVTAAPYAVFHGFSDLFEDFAPWVCRTTGLRTHGHLFGPEGADFAGGETGAPGALSTSPTLRDYDAEAFLRNLLWNNRDEGQAFLMSPRDTQSVLPFIARDPNALYVAVSGAWALPLLRSGLPLAELRVEAARLQRIESQALDRFRDRHARARVRIWSLAEVVQTPAEPLQTMIAALTLPGAGPLSELPALRPLDGLAGFLQSLRNAGMNPHVAGTFTEALAERALRQDAVEQRARIDARQQA